MPTSTIPPPTRPRQRALDALRRAQAAFLTGAAPYLAGRFEFFDGRDPCRIRPETFYHAMYQVSLQQFIGLRIVLCADR